ncbi:MULTISPECIES: cell division protein FtsX [Sphingomonas]|uniref:cell division protein FtsX n=1 Tax=Sphingomonas TaxID=13687 RepID=UPI0008333D0D
MVTRAPYADRRLLDAGRQSRAMVWIMAIMLFLTVLTGAFGLGALAASQTLERQLAGRLTVQVVEANPVARKAVAAAIVARLRVLPQVARVAPVDEGALAAMLRPWLGEQGTDPDLPIPAMIDVELREPGDAAVAVVTEAARRAAPTARIDRYESWMSPVASFMQLLIAIAAGLILLMAAATATVVMLAARAGLDSHRATIEVLHMLGSTDAQVARLFQRRIAIDTLYGGLLGTALALATIIFVGSQVGALGSDLLGGIAFGVRDWLILIALPIGFALLATVAARLAVLRALGQYL